MKHLRTKVILAAMFSAAFVLMAGSALAQKAVLTPDDVTGICINPNSPRANAVGGVASRLGGFPSGEALRDWADSNGVRLIVQVRVGTTSNPSTWAAENRRLQEHIDFWCWRRDERGQLVRTLHLCWIEMGQGTGWTPGNITDPSTGRTLQWEMIRGPGGSLPNFWSDDYQLSWALRQIDLAVELDGYPGLGWVSLGGHTEVGEPMRLGRPNGSGVQIDQFAPYGYDGREDDPSGSYYNGVVVPMLDIYRGAWQQTYVGATMGNRRRFSPRMYEDMIARGMGPFGSNGFNSQSRGGEFTERYLDYGWIYEWESGGQRNKAQLPLIDIYENVMQRDGGLVSGLTWQGRNRAASEAAMLRGMELFTPPPFLPSAPDPIPDPDPEPEPEPGPDPEPFPVVRVGDRVVHLPSGLPCVVRNVSRGGSMKLIADNGQKFKRVPREQVTPIN